MVEYSIYKQRSVRGIAELNEQISKGQLISEWLFDFAIFPKKQPKFFINFRPRI